MKKNERQRDQRDRSNWRDQRDDRDTCVGATRRADARGMLAYDLALLSHVCHIEKGRAWVSDTAAARSSYAKATADRSENIALPF